MKMIKAVWKGTQEERVRIRGEGYTANLHFIPNQEILLPEKALEKLRDQVLTERLVVVDINNCTEIEEDCSFYKLANEKEENKKVRKRRFKKEESSITTDSIDEEVCE